MAKEKLAIERDRTKSAQEKVRLEKDKTKTAQEKAKAEREAKQIEKQRREKLEQTMVNTLLEKGVGIESIAKIMEMTPKQVEKIIDKKHVNRN